MRSRVALLLLIAALLWWLRLSDLEPEISYQPLGLPIEITVNARGEISLSSEGALDIPTPIGTFGVGVVADPTAYFDTSQRDIQTTLTVRKNGKETFYDLNGMRAGTISFAPGYYQVISLSWRGQDLLLEIVSQDRPIENPASNLANHAGIAVSKVDDEFSCERTYFSAGMIAVAVQAVNVRTSPEVPPDWYANWEGIALQEGEEVMVIAAPTLTDGYWLKIRRSSGEEGWVKECTRQNGILVAPK